MVRWILAAVLAAMFQTAAAQSLLDVSQKEWVSLQPELRGQFIRATGIETGLGLKPDYLTIQQQPLSWSEGTRLVRVLGGWEPRSLIMYFLMRADGALIHLDGSYEAIRALNDSVPPTISPDTVADYVWFTGFFVRSKAGPFLIVETPQDRFLPPLETAPDQSPVLSSDLAGIPRKLTCTTAAAAEGFRCDGTVYHSNAIFAADFWVSATGEVDIPSSHPLAAKLAYRVNAPIDPRRHPGFFPFR